MKLTIGNGSPIEGRSIVFEHGMVMLRGKSGRLSDSLLLAYRLREGETARRVNEEGDYEINL